MVQVGQYNTLKVVKDVDFGFYLDGGEAGEILLPSRYVPAGLKPGDDLKVFIYHDSENRLIATTLEPKGVVGEIAFMEVVDITPPGAFLDMGLMKHIFVPVSQQESRMKKGESYLVKIYLDEKTGRIAATEKFSNQISNYELSVKELEPVDIIVFEKTDIGYKVIINSKHLGVLHYNEVFRDIDYGEKLKGFIKTIRPENKIDVSLGERGYKRVEGEEEKILRLLKENDGYLPYHDKSAPEEIHEFFGVSKKTFKMTIGSLYKQHKIELTKTGIKLADQSPA